MTSNADDSARAALRALVLDDDLISRLVLAEMVHSLGHTATELESAAEALEHALSGRFDVLLVDLSMPGADGFEILRRLRERETAYEASQLPVIAVTGHVDAETHARTRAAGFAAHLDKPVVLGALDAALGSIRAPRPTDARNGVRHHAGNASVEAAAVLPMLLALAGARADDTRHVRTLARAFERRTAQLVARISDRADDTERAEARHRLQACARAVGAKALASACTDDTTTGAALGEQFARLAQTLLQAAERRHAAPDGTATTR